MSTLYEWFWNSSIWLARNTTWEEMGYRNPDKWYPHASDLNFAIWICLILFPLRYHIISRFIFGPLGIWLGIKNIKRNHPPPYEPFEDLFCSGVKTPSKQQILTLVYKTGVTRRCVESWFRRRARVSVPTTLVKFVESGWRFTFYLTMNLYGAYFLLQTDWLFSPREYWTDVPLQHIESWMYWYYLIEFAFYMNLMVTQFTDVRRKDFWEMFAHHVCTLALLAGSWIGSYTRVGAVILLLHDSVDWWMELAKMAKYTGYRTLCDISFVIFMLSWILFRLYLLPFYAWHNAAYTSLEQLGWYHNYYWLNGALAILQTLHCVWFGMICRIAYRALVVGQVENDVRSDSEGNDEVSDDEIDTNTEKPENCDRNDNMEPFSLRRYTNGVSHNGGSHNGVSHNGVTHNGASHNGHSREARVAE